jgi:hypothetical protein
LAVLPAPFAVVSTARLAESTRPAPFDLGDEDLLGAPPDLALGELRDLLVRLLDEARDLLDELVRACDFRDP